MTMLAQTQSHLMGTLSGPTFLSDSMMNVYPFCTEAAASSQIASSLVSRPSTPADLGNVVSIT